MNGPRDGRSRSKDRTNERTSERNNERRNERTSGCIGERVSEWRLDGQMGDHDDDDGDGLAWNRQRLDFLPHLLLPCRRHRRRR